MTNWVLILYVITTVNQHGYREPEYVGNDGREAAVSFAN